MLLVGRINKIKAPTNPSYLSKVQKQLPTSSASTKNGSETLSSRTHVVPNWYVVYQAIRKKRAIRISEIKLLIPLAASFAGLAAGEVIFEDLHLVPKLVKAHGWIMATTFLIIFPLGAVLIRFAKFKGAVWVHAALQLVGWVLIIAGLAIGIRMAKILDYVGDIPCCLNLC